MKKKRHTANREPEADFDSGDFELAAEVKDDDSVRNEQLLFVVIYWLLGYVLGLFNLMRLVVV